MEKLNLGGREVEDTEPSGSSVVLEGRMCIFEGPPRCRAPLQFRLFGTVPILLI